MVHFVQRQPHNLPLLEEGLAICLALPKLLWLGQVALSTVYKQGDRLQQLSYMTSLFIQDSNQLSESAKPIHSHNTPVSRLQRGPTLVLEVPRFTLQQGPRNFS